nr:diacylglycerol kinase [Actinomycetales bacterium]
MQPALHPPGTVVVLNPTKTSNLPDLVERFTSIAREVGLPSPQIVETSEKDPGTTQALAAVTARAATVIAAGGDGTVRAVAAGLASTGTPMGIVPLGTGNLLARNLDLPITDLARCIRLALTDPALPLDLGWLVLDDDHSPSAATAAPAGQAAEGEDWDGTEPHAVGHPTDGTEPHAVGSGEEPERHAFLVIGGIGFDADMVGGADEALKRRFGWLAYFYSALDKLSSRRMNVTVTVDGRRRVAPFRSRTVMVANCGRLPGGVVLAPSARPDDGVLDILTLDTRAGVVGWISLGVKVLAQRLGIRGRTDPVSTIASRRGREFAVRSSRPEPVQIDGEWLGRAHGFRAWVDPGALVVRRPR